MNPALPNGRSGDRRKSWVNPALPNGRSGDRRKSWVNPALPNLIIRGRVGVISGKGRAG